ncbi:alpha/beta-hydrolase [Exidia glandulosa HHB12029]|uniref:Carboxypeptidase n=1 Tax=Exidia glandulosa HHB12029 TaxID=1314781 RepID=A0A165DGY3_EXIGL|nr:alpha/beta-hydrolase [Exidia glandulosa HHB12029]
MLRILALVAAAVAQQWAAKDSGASVFSSLHALDSVTHTRLTHPSFPRYGVRVKEVHDFCEKTGAKTYAGYVDVDARHFFFYFFESRGNPAEDPVVLWMNGGPGCTSTTGLFLENGPCILDDQNTSEPKHNPYSWNSNSSIIFLEQPVGTGFSYAEHGEHTSTTVEAAADFVAFISIWFNSFSDFRGRALHLSGESYAGRMLPVFASALVDANAVATQDGREPVNLQSVLIVNGFTNYMTMSLTSYDMLCTNASLPPLLPISTCVRMKAALPRCEKWYTESCVDVWDATSCAAAANFCATELATVVEQTGRNLYDLGEVCNGRCDGVHKPYVDDYLNRADVRKRLGVDEWTGDRNITMTGCGLGSEIMKAYTAAGDQLHSSNPYTEALLHRNIRVMHLVGSYDWICNWVGNLREAAKLEWPGQEGFNALELHDWTYEGKRAGKAKSFGGLSFVTLDGAGHAAPAKRRPESLHVLQQWLHGQSV